MTSGDSRGTVRGGGDCGRLDTVAPHLRRIAASPLQLIDAMWECEFLVARSYFREDSNTHFLGEIA